MSLRLPPLQEPDQVSYVTDSLSRVYEVRSYTSDQMRAHERAVLEAVAAWLESRAQQLAENEHDNLYLVSDELRAALSGKGDICGHL